MRTSIDAHKAVAVRLFDDLFNHGCLDLTVELVAADLVSPLAALDAPQGPAGICRVVEALHAAFPDGRHVIDDLIAEADTVVARVTFSGTHRGSFLGVPPTGRRVRQAQMHILRIADGKVAEHWAVRDDLSLLRQLDGPGPSVSPSWRGP